MPSVAIYGRILLHLSGQNDTYLCQYTRSSLVRTMARRLCGSKLCLSKSVMAYPSLDPGEEKSVQFQPLRRFLAQLPWHIQVL